MMWGERGEPAMPRGTQKPTVIYTIGHSVLPLETFVERLKAFGVQRVVDVRTVPRSRHNPQFDRQTLPRELRRKGIGYIHVKGLGGLRHATRDSVNTGWRNASFRGFADYMRSSNFERSLQGLVRMAGRKTVALMCAEAVPFRCHRSLIADALTVRGLEVRHITSGRTAKPHSLTPWISVKDGTITYPGPAPAGGAAADEDRQRQEKDHDRTVPV